MPHEILNYHKTLDNSSIRNNIDRRVELIKQLRDIVSAHEQEIIEAFRKDLNRNSFTTKLMDFSSFYGECEYFIANTHKLTKEQEVETAAMFKPHKSFIVPRPYGKILILVPFNYPMALSLTPLVGSIAAGNSSLIRMSNKTRNVSNLFLNLFTSMPKEIVQFMMCSYEECDELIGAGFDKILYTGSPSVGKHIMALAAETLTPVLLELGGKSPLIIDETCDLASSLPSAIWGKCTNAGQTCVAPDFVLIKRERLEEFKMKTNEIIKEFYPDGMLASNDFCRMIDDNSWNRVDELIKHSKGHAQMLCHDNSEPNKQERYIPFRSFIFESIESAEHTEIMRREIFGPVWPVLPYDDIEEVFAFLGRYPPPLSLYIYSENEETINRFVNDVPAGAVVANDTMIQFENHTLPFGGIGNSGMGNYHAKFTFEALSHMKPVMKRSFTHNGLSKAINAITGANKEKDIRFPPNTQENEKKLDDFKK